MLPTMPRARARSTCSSCATPLCITATRVSCGVQLMRMSSVTARPSLEASAFRAEGLDQLRRLVERQAHDARVAAAQLRYEHSRASLDRVAAGLDHGLAGVDVGLDLGVREL